MIARDQKPLIAEGADQLARHGPQDVAEAGIGVRRAGIAEHGRAIPAAGRDGLDELGGLLDPAGVQHRAGREEHQPGRTGLERAGGQRFALRRSLAADEAAAGDVGNALDDAVACAVDQQNFLDDARRGTGDQRGQSCDRGLLDAFGRNDDAQHD